MGFATEVKSKIFSFLSLKTDNDFADYGRILDLYHNKQGQSQIRNVSKWQCSDAYLIFVKWSICSKMRYSQLLVFSW